MEDFGDCKVICINCRYYSCIWERLSADACWHKPNTYEDYIRGTITIYPRQCKNKNILGNCPDFEHIPKKEHWWQSEWDAEHQSY